MPADFPDPDLTLSDFPFVSSLADSANPEDRRIWLRVACDHFVLAARSAPEAVERFADAVARQIETAGMEATLEAARKLARSPKTPARLLDTLAAGGPEASDHVLEHGAAYATPDLLRAIERGSRQAVAVARRPDLDSKLIAALVARDDTEVLAALAANPRARLEGSVLFGLLHRARALAEDRGDRRLAEVLLQRRPLRLESAALFLLADPLQRVEILLAAQRAQLGRPPGAPPAVAPEIVAELEVSAVARQPKRFVAVLAQALECDPALAERIAGDPSGEPLAVAMSALGAPGDVLVRVLIANDLEAGEAYGRIRALARLNNALNRKAALAVMTALCGQTPGRRRISAPGDVAPRETPSRRIQRPALQTQRKAAV